MAIAHRAARTAGRALGMGRAGEDRLAWQKVAARAPRTVEVTSPVLTDGGEVPRMATADGKGAPVPIRWSSLPDEARSVVVLCEDPDAPMEEPFVHWLVYDVPADARAVDAEGQFPEGKNSTLRMGFAPVAPPPGHGVHHYHFEVFALDAPLSLQPGLGRGAVLDAMRGHVVAWGDLVGTYQRG